MMDLLKIVILAIIEITSEYIKKPKDGNGDNKGGRK